MSADSFSSSRVTPAFLGRLADRFGKRCQTGAAVVDDHIWNSPLLGYVNAADNKCGTGNGNIGSGPIPPGTPPFNPDSTFGHMHPGPAEWWIVQAGQIRGQFENTEGWLAAVLPFLASLN